MKTVKHEKSIHAIFQQDPQNILGFIQQRMHQLKTLDLIWKASITTDLASHSRIANFRDSCLVIEIDSAAWATRLRYLLPNLIKKLAVDPAFNTLKHIEWYIQPRFHVPTQKISLSPTLSRASAQLLRNAAANLNAPDLKEALIKLASRETLSSNTANPFVQLYEEP